MRTLIALGLTVMVAGSTAYAQPGADPQQAPPPPPQQQQQQQPYPQQQQPYPQQPQQYPQQPQQYPQQPQQPQQYPQQGYGWQPQRPVMQYQLTVDEQYLLERGYISDGQHIGGGLLALFVGGGLGQAVQGRWTEKGYIFTLGEAASIGLMIWGIAGLAEDFADDCFDCPYDEHDNSNASYGWMIAGGLIGYTVFHIWEVVDAFAGPAEHNRKLTQLRWRLGMPVPRYTKLTPYVVPSRAGDGAVAGFSLSF